MSMSRTRQVLLSQGDPIIGLGGLARLGGGIFQRALPGLGGLIKRGASKIIQIARGPTARAVAGGAAGAVAVEAATRVFGGGGAAMPGGFQVLRVSRPRAASPGGRPLQLLTAQGRIINLQRRRRGISATELRGFRKVVSLLSRVGMTPRRLGGRRRHKKGNPE